MSADIKDGWLAAARVDEFETTDRKLVDGGKAGKLVVFKTDNEYCAVELMCSHQRVPLLEGEVENGEVECPMHGARFCLKTGKNKSLPAVRPIKAFEVNVENGQIYVKV